MLFIFINTKILEMRWINLIYIEIEELYFIY